jgi:tryptophanyl-tRNA synthetase
MTDYKNLKLIASSSPHIRSNEEYMEKVARMGAEKARESAAKTLAEVREIIGFRPY